MAAICLQMGKWTLALVLFVESLSLHVDCLLDNHLGHRNFIRTFNTIKEPYGQNNLKVFTTLRCLRLVYISANKIGRHNMEETDNGDDYQTIE